MRAVADIETIQSRLARALREHRQRISSALDAVITIDQALDQPLTGPTRGRFVPIRDLQGIFAAAEFGQLQVRESAGLQVGTHHRFRHAAPTDTG
jgi:hypothetical protein